MRHSLNHAKLLFLAFCVAALAACSSLGVASPETNKQKLAAAYTTVQTVAQVADQLARTGKLDKKDVQNVVQTNDAALSGLDAAKDMIQAGDVSGAATKLDQIQAVLLALQSYLSTKGAK